MILAAAALLLLGAAAHGTPVRLDVPVIEQARERCGPAALAMVIRYYGGSASALAEAERAYDPALGGALITDLAAAARRAGYRAAVETPAADSLAVPLQRGVPPIVLYQRGIGPVARGHYAVIVGWDETRHEYTLHDGGRRPRRMRAAELVRRWWSAGGRVLIVERSE